MKKRAALVFCLALASCTSAGQSAHKTASPSASQSVPSSPRITPKNTLPAGDSGKTFVLDLTWISTETGWALFSAPCATGRCPEIEKTTNGGLTWIELPSPPGIVHTDSIDCETAPCVQAIRFATAKVGYLFGGAFYVTLDGGRTWTRQKSQLVEALEPANGNVVRMVFDQAGCPGPCNRYVQVADAGSDSWRTVLHVSVDMLGGDSRASTSQLIRAGSRAIYIPIYGDTAAGAGSQHAIIFRSLDGGETWKRLADPCGTHRGLYFDAIAFAAVPGGFASTICVTRGGAGPGDFLLTSQNYGSLWSPMRPIPDWAEEIAAATSKRLVVAAPGVTGNGHYVYQLAVSKDAGQHWSTVVRDRELVNDFPGTFLGFESASVGRWIAEPTAIWTTTDGGLSWFRRSVD